MKAALIAMLALAASPGIASAQDSNFVMHPHFERGINARPPGPAARAAALPTFTFAWSYQTRQYSAVFMGKKPSTGLSTTIPVYLIPVELTYGTTSADPTVADSSGVSPVNRTLSSPVFKRNIDFVAAGGVDMGKTQYIDAFERANLWGTVQSQTGYHVYFGTPQVTAKQTLVVPKNQGTIATAFGVKAIIANINWFDPQAEALLTSLQIPARSIAVFITTQSYLSDNAGTSGCCIGGYHSYTGTQAYAHFTFITPPSGLAFSNDVSALSHELGEYVDDPYTNNTDVPASCATQGNGQQIYEVGDPIEVDTNYGDFDVKSGGYTYHLQDLVNPTYFGASAGTSTTGQSFKGLSFSVCQNGG